MPKPKAVSLFSGCGGSDYGLLKAGFEIVMANDNLPAAKRVYESNLETDYHLCDIATLKSFPEAELLVGCYPCQGFSQGGVRRSDRKINYLYREFDRALRLIKPKAFIVENVSGMTRSDFRHLLNNQITRFRLAGYRVSWKVLNALDYGVAQERRRIFLVGIKSTIDSRFVFPVPTHGPGCKRRHKTQNDVIKDLPEWPDGEFCQDDFHWYYLSRNRYRGWMEPSKTIVSRDRHIPLHPISPKLIKLGEDRWVFENNSPARRLSYREAARLQGFPKNFMIPDDLKLGKKYQVIGNAVPPPLFEAIARALPPIWN